MINLPGYKQSENDDKVREAVRKALTTGASRTMTICEQLRFIYDTVYQLPDGAIKEDLTEKLIDAFNMGKKMNARLAHLKRKYIDKTGHRGKSLVKLTDTRLRERLRGERQ